MNAIHTKSTFLYERIRRALQAGRYVPGQRIEPAAMAREFKTSQTPVRLALYRLIGEGMISDHARGGLFVPLLSDLMLRDRYEWMERLLLVACEIGWSETPHRHRKLLTLGDDSDLAKATWKLFDAIAEETGKRSLHDAVRRINDQLAPVRRAKESLIDNVHAEFADLHTAWRDRDVTALKTDISAYHDRRKQLVPKIVALLIEQSEHLH
ncbi:GntR family transcriptional regulator [Luteimonas fraxinea]|uniref:GntR family transcriptional regulator n=1 Tax=Luteimonas fraxinea TaxID=2901869 RepID=UPI001E4DC1CA|nr:GntR family transcriptional regulator [Luteimonas fraxinea]MCD9125347.1 GntR family transcriptional regulator [Luteimonas fraxinea]